MSLRRALGTAWQPPTTFAWRPQLVQREVERIAKIWGDRKEHTPPKVELDATVIRVKEAWARGLPLRELARRDRSLLPFVLFHPAGKGREREWLGSDPAFAHGFLKFLEGESRALSSTAFVLLRDYPRVLNTFDQLRQGFCGTLVRDEGLRTEAWRHGQQKYSLFAPDGPSKFATMLGEAESRTEALLQDAGLVDELAVGGFMREVHGRMLALVGERLLAGADALWLRGPLEFLGGKHGHLRFDEESASVANALFLSTRNTVLRDATRKALQSFALTYLHDPRVSNKKWLGAPEARDVFLQWLVGATLEDFFRIIGKHALMKHWEYRQAFWRAYLRKGVIGDACVVLGDDARALAEQGFKESYLVYRNLWGGERNHSVLLLNIGGLTIAEWSHNGTCRVWFDGNRHRPRLHKDDYRKEELTLKADHEQRHDGSLNYRWQANLAAVIEEQTGIRVTESDYRVR